LWAEGLTPETTSFSEDIIRAYGQYREKCVELPTEKRDPLLERFDKWVSHSSQASQAKDEPRYAGYDAGYELAVLYDESPGVASIEILNELEELKEKQSRLIELQKHRSRLLDLQVKHARIFSDTAESRRDHTEQMAQLFWTCERADLEGKTQGKLSANFESLWNWPEAAVQWLLYEAFFFHNNVPDVARNYLGAFGFFTAERASTESDKSGELPAPPSSKIDTAPAVETPKDSSALPVATT
jgi:hypothetical protein